MIKKNKESKQRRLEAVLIGLVDLYLTTGKPVGSNTLQSSGLEAMSSATIRNYFVELEEMGCLEQLHCSGGRIPTGKALRIYAEKVLESKSKMALPEDSLDRFKHEQTREIAAYLQKMADELSELTGTAVFLSLPRFDHDFVTGIRLVDLDEKRLICIITTDFGLVHTHQMKLEEKLSSFALKRLENFFTWKLKQDNKPDLSKNEEIIGEKIYSEVMLRHIVGYSNFHSEDVYKTGFSKLLSYPEFSEAAALGSALSIFESPDYMRHLTSECCRNEALSFWIGDELSPPLPESSNCAVCAIPYKINHSVVGALALLGPMRMPYKQVFALLDEVAKEMSLLLTKSVYKYKITYRQPEPTSIDFVNNDANYMQQTETLLLEEKS